MKKLISTVLAVIFTASLLVGCMTTTTNPDGTTTTTGINVQQVAAQVCGPLQAAVTVLNTPGNLSPALSADFATVTPIISTVCAVGSTVDASSLGKLASTGLSGLMQILAVAPIPQNEKMGISVGLAVTQAVLADILARNPQLVATKDLSAPIGILPGVKATLLAKNIK